ncbi:cytochrome P450 [Streptomyces sp. NPDC000134]|uniref:cytochrome P450 n=1 Tax=Streptomyces sp. NPDC000134 TaxID=3364536 RepID=UPI0036D1745E
MSDPLDVVTHRDGLDPLPELRRMSAETPLVEAGDHLWMAVGRTEIRAVLSDTARFTTRPPAENEEASRRLAEPGNPFHYDPPEHTRIRRMLTPEFTVGRTRSMQPLIEEIVRERLDFLERTGPPADLMRLVAWPVTGLITCSLLGIPRDDVDEITRNTTVRANGTGTKQLAAGNAHRAYLEALVARKRRHPDGDDLPSRLIREHGPEVTDDELRGMCSAVLLSELEGGAHMLGGSALALMQHPDQFALLRARPELTDRAVEELLRYLTIVPGVSPRTAREDVPLAGRVIKAGDIVHCALLAANRAQPPGAPRDDLDITRDSTGHMAFGHGIHFCVGAPLARTQTKIFLAALVERFPGLRLAIPPDKLRFRLRSPQHGLEALPVAW